MQVIFRLNQCVFCSFCKSQTLTIFFFNFYLFIYLFIYGCVGSSFLCEGFLQLWQAGATLHRGAWASHYHGLSCLRSTGSRRAGSVVVAHGPNCSAACGIFPDQGSNPCPLHWQADSQPLCHHGSPFSLLIASLLLTELRSLLFYKIRQNFCFVNFKKQV